jgi:S1-C subfamily serine protease
MLGGLRDPNGILVAATLFQIGGLNGGFMPGDVIHQINGRGVGSIDAVRGSLNQLRRGDPCVVQIERRGQLKYLAFEISD